MANLTTKEKDLKYIMHTYGRYDVALKSAKGVTAYDENGKKYIDVSSGIGVNSLGYCNDGWVEAVSKQAGTIQHMSNYFYCSQASDLAESFAHLQVFQRSALATAVQRLTNAQSKLPVSTALTNTARAEMKS